jgi:putative ABC transport system ATP-binding protein
MEIFQRLNADLGITVVIVTHEPLIAEHTRRILRILDGQLSGDEPVRESRLATDELHDASPDHSREVGITGSEAPGESP